MSRVEKIVIVGGGTAGWISAVVLNRALRAGPSRDLGITLIESSEIGTIGVGESTVPTLRETLRYAVIDERDFLLACNATFKLAIRFVNWAHGQDEYWHPFGPVGDVRGSEFSILRHWISEQARNRVEPFDRACFSGSVQAAEARRSPQTLGDPPYEARLAYAYHLDAGLFATFLSDIATQRGVVHVVDDVQAVVLDAEGFISHLSTKRTGDIHGDLFIDCTGFRGLLINQTLGEPFESYADFLLCDSAIALGVPISEEVRSRDTYTTAAALSAGWTWKVPLQHRTGNGYVYSSPFITRDDATAEFLAHLGLESRNAEPRHLKMRVGRTRRPWVKNCVSIGLAAGFIEPLESTGIFLIEHGVNELILHFPDREFDPRLITHYNEVMRRVYEEIRDFVLLHYILTQREDTAFWRANKHDPRIPDSLRSLLDLYEVGILPKHDPSRWGFNEFSHMAILAGMGRLPMRPDPIMAYQDRAFTEWAFMGAKDDAGQLVRTLPDHGEYLQSIRAAGRPVQGH